MPSFLSLSPYHSDFLPVHICSLQCLNVSFLLHSQSLVFVCARKTTSCQDVWSQQGGNGSWPEVTSFCWNRLFQGSYVRYRDSIGVAWCIKASMDPLLTRCSYYSFGHSIKKVVVFSSAWTLHEHEWGKSGHKGRSKIDPKTFNQLQSLASFLHPVICMPSYLAKRRNPVHNFWWYEQELPCKLRKIAIFIVSHEALRIFIWCFQF